MSEEDYLSDKFLVEAVASSSPPKTYAQRRQESLKQSRIKNEQNRPKSRQREQESREEGLRKSLFERVKEDSEGGKNKALGIMLKMGFKMGQSLGQREGSPAREGTSSPGPSGSETRESLSEHTERGNISPASIHRAEPLPLNEWTGSS